MAFLVTGMATPSGALSSPAPTGAGSPRSGLGRRRLLAIVVVAGFLATGILAAVVFLGEGGPTPPPTFSQARAEMERAVGNYSGGGWTLLNALGLDERTGSTVTLSTITNRSGTNCVPGSLSGFPLPSTVSIPSYSGSFSSGRAPFWFFLLRQPTDDHYLIVIATGSSATPVANLTGPGCAASAAAISPVASPLADSPTVAGDAWTGTANASAFVAGDPAIDSLILFATGTTTVDHVTFSGWGLVYSPCPPFESGSTTNETTYVVAFSSAGGYDGSLTSTTGCPAG